MQYYNIVLNLCSGTQVKCLTVPSGRAVNRPIIKFWVKPFGDNVLPYFSVIIVNLQ